MTHLSGAGSARTNGTRQLSFPRLAEAYDRPPAAGSFPDDTSEAREARTACGGSRQEGKEAKYSRYRLLFKEMCSRWPTSNWDKRRTTYASLVALQGCATEDATDLVLEVMTESESKANSLRWFCTTVLIRLKEHDLWSRDLCYWFNKRKQRMDSVESFQTMFDD